MTYFAPEPIPLPDLLENSSLDRVELAHRILGPDVCRRLGIFRLPDDFLLTVVIPVYNEAATVEHVVDRVKAAGLPVEIILVDDGSRDGSWDVLTRLQQADDSLRLIRHECNQGKGAALRTGFLEARGDVVVVQDADLEYDPRDLRLLLQPIVENRADVVYGSRYSGREGHVAPLWHRLVNRGITWLSNVFTGLRFTDVETCYKMFRREVIQTLAPTLRERRFGVELELTAKIARDKRLRIYERPISYVHRTYAEGKKIGFRDGLRALWCIVRY